MLKPWFRFLYELMIFEAYFRILHHYCAYLWNFATFLHPVPLRLIPALSLKSETHIWRTKHAKGTKTNICWEKLVATFDLSRKVERKTSSWAKVQRRVGRGMLQWRESLEARDLHLISPDCRAARLPREQLLEARTSPSYFSVISACRTWSSMAPLRWWINVDRIVKWAVWKGPCTCMLMSVNSFWSDNISIPLQGRGGGGGGVGGGGGR